MTKQFISEMQEGQKINSHFALASKQLVPYSRQGARAGDEFLKLTLKDKSGNIRAVVWDNAPEIHASFDVDDVVYIEGIVSKYNGLQVTVHSIEAVSPDGIDMSDFVPTTTSSISFLWEQFGKLTDTIENTHIKKIIDTLFTGELKNLFASTPGGKKVHHACRGGLLEHTLEVASISARISSLYRQAINRDILLAGALFHDIGKTQEYDPNSISFSVTDKGKLYGHLVLGRDILLKCTSTIPDFPPELEDELGHMILSHHGCREWGSPEPPKTVEALALFHADYMSARINQAAGLVSSATESWTPYNFMLERSFFVPERIKDSNRNSDAETAANREE